MKPDTTRNARAAKFRSKQDGGAQINTRIGPDAAVALAKLREQMSLRIAVEHALIALAAK